MSIQGPDADAVRGLFSRIASRYDLLNTLLSFGQDRRWRNVAARIAAPGPGERFLDLAAGTGAFSKSLKYAEPEVCVVAADFCFPILRLMPAGLGRRIAADALCMPFRAGTFDGLVIAFGIRNFSDPGRGLAEMNRVLKSGGRGLILEFFRPENSLAGFLYRVYLRLCIPILGGILSGSFPAYRHLSGTIRRFSARSEFYALLDASGFEVAGVRELSFGAATAVEIRKKS